MLEKNGNFRFSYPQTPKYWQKRLPIKLETWASFVCTQSLGFTNHLYIHSLYTSIILKKIMKDYAMISPTRSRKYFLPCLSIMSPISGSETGPAGYDAAEGQARSTGNGDELESQIPQKHTQNPRSPVTKPRAMQMMIPI